MSTKYFAPAPLAAALLVAIACPIHAEALAAADAQTLDRVEVVGKLDKHATSAITATRTGTALKDVL